MQRLLLLMSVSAALAGCAPDSGLRDARPPPGVSTPAGQSLAPSSPPSSEPLAAGELPLPPQAEAVARTYAIAALSSRIGAWPASFVNEVAPICTSAWLAALRSGAGPTGASVWADGVAPDAQDSVATVLDIYASRTTGPGRRAVVAARIDTGGPKPTHRAAVITLDLVEQAEGWRVGFAS